MTGEGKQDIMSVRTQWKREADGTVADTRRCPNCGEYYAATYRKCPFCGYIPQRRKGGKRLARSRARTGLRVLLLLAAIILALFLLYSIFQSFLDNAPTTTDAAVSPSVTVSGDGEGDGAVAPVVSGGDTEEAEVSPSGTLPPVTGEDAPPVLEKTDISLFAAGQTAKLKLTYAPPGEITWSSSDESVATVSGDGTVTAVGKGKATITVTGGGSEVTCIVRVRISDTAVSPSPSVSAGSSASLNKTDITFFAPGESFTLKVSGSSAAFSWSSSNTDVAAVDSKGKVTAVGEGTARITASSGNISLTCVVRVKAS